MDSAKDTNFGCDAAQTRIHISFLLLLSLLLLTLLFLAAVYRLLIVFFAICLVLCIHNDLNRYFSEEDTQMGNKHMERCSPSVVMKEMQIKTTVRCHVTLTIMAMMQRMGERRIGWDLEEGDT